MSGSYRDSLAWVKSNPVLAADTIGDQFETICNQAEVIESLTKYSKKLKTELDESRSAIVKLKNQIAVLSVCFKQYHNSIADSLGFKTAEDNDRHVP